MFEIAQLFSLTLARVYAFQKELAPSRTQLLETDCDLVYWNPTDTASFLIRGLGSHYCLSSVLATLRNAVEEQERRLKHKLAGIYIHAHTCMQSRHQQNEPHSLNYAL